MYIENYNINTNQNIEEEKYLQIAKIYYNFQKVKSNEG